MRNFKILEKSGVFLKFVETENGLYLNSIASVGDLPNNDIGFLPFICCAAGVTCGSTGADSAVYKVFIGEFRQTDFVENENLLKIKYRSDKLSCETETEYRFLGGGTEERGARGGNYVLRKFCNDGRRCVTREEGRLRFALYGESFRERLRGFENRGGKRGRFDRTRRDFIFRRFFKRRGVDED